jgi:hypothetical protein
MLFQSLPLLFLPLLTSLLSPSSSFCSLIPLPSNLYLSFSPLQAIVHYWAQLFMYPNCGVWCWHWCDFGVILVWFWCDFGVVLVWFWCGVGVVLVWCWCGVGVVLVWCWCGVGVVLVWCWCGVGVALVWC